MSDLFRKFLGAERWFELFEAFRRASAADLSPRLGTRDIGIATLVAVTPPLTTMLERGTGATAGTSSTLALGVSTILALLLRARLLQEQKEPLRLGHSLRLAHTAFALGCVPAIAILCLFPQMLAERHDVLVNVTTRGGAVKRPSPIELWALVAAIAAWAAVTEEVIFRGLLLSAFRRWSVIGTQRARDITAIAVSALIFGAAHWPTWGAPAAVALTGLGAGFSLAYIVNGERLRPVVLYHFVFDVLSIGVSVYS